MPPTDPGLDERVCRKLGWGPIGTWDPAFYGYDPHDPECPPCSPIWPPVSSSWELAGKALEELEKHGMWARVSGPHVIGGFSRDGGKWREYFKHAGDAPKVSTAYGAVTVGQRSTKDRLYCGVHYPPAIKEKDEKKSKAWEKKYNLVNQKKRPPAA